MIMDHTKINQKFFHDHVKRGPGCWEWTGFLDNKGYGRMNVARTTGVGRTSQGAHRVSWVIENGPIPNGLHVLHSCDNPKCVNPGHLRLGTHQDNMKDASERGRYPRRKGSDSPVSKISAEHRAEISNCFDSPDRKKIRLLWAARLGVTPQCIDQIWKLRRAETRPAQ